nr:MAG TPA: hypothetical protein [Caudoviricetes sp.]
MACVSIHTGRRLANDASHDDSKTNPFGVIISKVLLDFGKVVTRHFQGHQHCSNLHTEQAPRLLPVVNQRHLSTSKCGPSKNLAVRNG